MNPRRTARIKSSLKWRGPSSPNQPVLFAPEPALSKLARFLSRMVAHRNLVTLRASNESLLFSRLPHLKRRAEGPCHCAHQATTACIVGLCEQGGHLTRSSPSLVRLSLSKRAAAWIRSPACASNDHSLFVGFPRARGPTRPRHHFLLLTNASSPSAAPARGFHSGCNYSRDPAPRDRTRFTTSLEFACQFRHRPQQQRVSGGDRLLMAIGRPLLHHLRARSIVHHPLDAEGAVELRAKTGGEETGR